LTKNIANARRVFLVLCLLFIFVWCNPVTEMHFYDNPDEMEQEILRYIPIGSSIADAKIMMERNRFNCTYSENETFVRERGSQSNFRQTLYKGDHLYCFRERRVLLSYQKWQASIVYKNKHVTAVYVSAGWVNL
jgi:hypothetical protein